MVSCSHLMLMSRRAPLTRRDLSLMWQSRSRACVLCGEQSLPFLLVRRDTRRLRCVSPRILPVFCSQLYCNAHEGEMRIAPLGQENYLFIFSSCSLAIVPTTHEPGL